MLILVGVLYTLVPEGRQRNTGKWVATGLVALAGLGLVGLGADAPSDVLAGVAIGVAIPLLLFRWFSPTDGTITYRRGALVPGLGGADGAAIRRGLADQLGFGRRRGQAVRPLRLGRLHPAADHRRRRPPRQLFGKLYARGHLRSDRWYKLRRELLYRRLGTRSRSTPSAASSSRRTMPCR